MQQKVRTEELEVIEGLVASELQKRDPKVGENLLEKQWEDLRQVPGYI